MPAVDRASNGAFGAWSLAARALRVLAAACLLLGQLSHAQPARAVDAPAEQAAATGGSPIAVVETLHDVLLSCMKGECGPGFSDRYSRIVQTLDETFDLPFMAQISIGRAWRSLSAEERRLYFKLSRQLSASNYAHNFDGYGGQIFKTLGQEPAARNTILVKTELIQPEDDNVRFDYRLREKGGRWLIIDITLDGKVSEMTLRRADYGAVIERRGFDELVDSIEEKIAKLEKD